MMVASSRVQRGAEISINSGVSVQSSAARTGRCGIELREHRAVKRELADIGRGRLGGGRRRGVIGLVIDDQDLVRPSPPAGRSGPTPEPGAARPLQPAGDRDLGAAAGAQIPARNAHRRSAPARSPPAFRAPPRSSRRHCGRGSPARPRGGARLATSGSDCSSRCTSVPRRSARARTARDSPARTRRLVILGGI